jgi:phosphatidylglycerophosphate synthase
MAHPVVNPANAITAARMLAMFPFWYAVDRGLPQWAVAIILIAGLMDLLDGLAARVFDCRSQFGEVFDAVADGVLYAVCLVVLAGYGWIPWWGIVGIVGLGIYNAALRFRYAARVGKATNFQSFAMERFAGFTAYLIGIGAARIETEYFFGAAIAIMAVIVAHDTKRMLFDPVPA